MSTVLKPNFSAVYSRANEILATSNVITSFPYSPFDLVKEQLGVPCRSYQMAKSKYGLDVSALGSESAVVVELGGKQIIFYDNSKPESHVKFSILHEMGHPANDHDLSVKDLDTYRILHPSPFVDRRIYMLGIYKPCTGATRAVTDSFQAYLTEGAHFTETEEYPILRPDMIATELPVKIMPFQKAITFQGDLSDTFICSYSPDQTFERIRRQPAKYLKFFKRTAGLIGFDFSIHTDMPIIKQKAQIYDNLALTYFFGNNGIPIIPNLRCGVDELLPEFLNTIPHHSKIAVGTHGFIKKAREKLEWYYFPRPGNYRTRTHICDCLWNTAR